MRDETEAVEFGHAEVDHGKIEGLARQALPGIAPVLDANHGGRLVAQAGLHHLAHDGIIVGD